MNANGAPELQIKQTDAASYDAVADRFDEMSERFSAGIADKLIELADVGPQDRVLDLGAGAGLVALRAGARAAGGSVVGIDHSAGMLRQASAKARDRGLSERVSFVEMDAEALDFETGAFDLAVSLFVLLHLPDPAKAVRELHRVVKPGGRVAIGMGAGPKLVSLEGAAQAARRLRDGADAAMGRLLTAPAFMKALMSEQGFGEPQTGRVAHHHLDVAALLASAGFTKIRSVWAGASFTLTVDEFWDVCAVYGSAERVRLAQLSAEQRARVKDEFVRRAKLVLSRGGRLVYPCGARIFLAERP